MYLYLLLSNTEPFHTDILLGGLLGYGYLEGQTLSKRETS